MAEANVDYRTLYNVRIRDDVLKNIELLFHALDVHSRNYLTADDFTLGGVNLADLEGASFWQGFSKYFDVNGDNCVEPAEFVRGFKLYALSQTVPPITTARSLETLLLEIDEWVNQVIMTWASAILADFKDKCTMAQRMSLERMGSRSGLM